MRPDPTFTPFEIQAIVGDPPAPGDRWLADLKPKWTVYAFLCAQNAGTWHVIRTDDAVWAHKGSAALRKMGLEAVARGPAIYARMAPMEVTT